MRAADGPLSMFLEGARRLVRAPLPSAAIWLLALIASYASGRIVSFDDIDFWTDASGVDWRAAAAFAFWLVPFTFLLGGVLSRYAHPGRRGTAAFLADCRAYAGRMLRLTLTGVVIYHVIHGYLEPALRSIHGDAGSIPAFAASFFVQILLQLTAVRTVVEDRRSLLFALAAGWRLLTARPLAVLVLYGLTVVALIVWMFPVVLILGYAGPAADGPPGWVWNQVLTTAVVWLDLQVLASLIALHEAMMARRHFEQDRAVTPSGLSGLNAVTAKE